MKLGSVGKIVKKNKCSGYFLIIVPSFYCEPIEISSDFYKILDFPVRNYSIPLHALIPNYISFINFFAVLI